MNSNTTAPRRSAAGLTVPRPRLTAPEDDLLTRLRKLMEYIGPNRNERAIVAIAACIDEGINTAPCIRRVLAQLGFDPRHAALMLKLRTGDRSVRPSWTLDAEGRFALLP